MRRTPAPCCSYAGLNKGPWTPDEDFRLIKYIEAHGQGNWRSVPKKAGLQRCGKGCRLRWMNYLRPNVKRGHILPDEEDMIIRLHKLLGNRWSLIAGRIPGRTDNEVKNYWNTHLRKKFNATKGLRRNTRIGCDKICEGRTRALSVNEDGSSFSPYKDAGTTRHTVNNDQNKISACSHIGEIVSILKGAEELYNCTTNARRDPESIENLKQLIDGFHDPVITMDSIDSAINNIHGACSNGIHHPFSYVPASIYPPGFEPKTCPSDYMNKGFYQSMSDNITSTQGLEPAWLQVHNFVSGNYMNSGEKTIGDEINNMQSRTAVEPQIKIHPYAFTEDALHVDWNVFDPCSNMVSPDVDHGQNMRLNSFLQPQDPTTDQCSEPCLSSFDWFDRIEQLYS